MNINSYPRIIIFFILLADFSYSFCKDFSYNENDTSIVDSVIIRLSNTVPIEERIGEIRIYSDKITLSTFPLFMDKLLKPDYKMKLSYANNQLHDDSFDNQLLRLFVKELFVQKKYQIIKSKIKTDYMIRSHSNPQKIDLYVYKNGSYDRYSIKYEDCFKGQNISVIEGYEVHYEPRFLMFYNLIYIVFKEARNGLL